MPCIIIEGPDGAGKTTLADALISHWAEVNPVGRATLLHRGPRVLDSIRDYEMPLQEFDLFTDLVICDRWHLGEEVYGPLLRGESKTTAAQFRHIEAYLRARGALVVLLDLPTETIQLRLKQRGGDDADWPIDKIDALRRGYTQLEERMTLPSLFFLKELDDLDTTALSILWAWQAHAPQPHPFKTLIGDVRSPRYLLLGDQKSALGDGLDAAFCPVPGSVGSYFLDLIDPADWVQTAIANANEEDLRALIRYVEPVEVVALGGRAAEACQREGVRHRRVPHPQFVRRFQHKQLGRYVKEIFTL